MSLFFSIFIYTLFAVLLYWMGQNERVMFLSNPRRSFLTPYTFTIILIFTILSGIRYRVGVDCESYANIFDLIKQGINPNQSSSREFERGFVFISSIIAKLGFSRVIYLSIWALFQVLFFYYALKNKRFLYPYVGIVLILGSFYLMWMNAIRQMIVACIFVLASQKLYEENRRLLFVVLILLALLFHHSAIILLFFLIIPNREYFPNKNLCIVVLIACAILGQIGIIQSHLGIFERFVGQFSQYDTYTDNFEYFTEVVQTKSYGPRRIVLLLSSLMVIWFYPQMKAHYSSDLFFQLSYNLFFIYVCINDNLLSNASSIFSRPLLYLQPFTIISIAYLLNYLRNIMKNKLLYYLAILLSCSYMYIECVATVDIPFESSNYKIYHKNINI